jgi:hypothetical protein
MIHGHLGTGTRLSAVLVPKFPGFQGSPEKQETAC